MQSSPISNIILEGREFLVKRDDLFDPYLSGNKYRKLHALLNTPKQKYSKIISYGGTQSNAMLAIAAMCKQKEWEFVYYTKPISKTQKEQKVGNFYIALELGMQHKELEVELYHEYISALGLNINEDVCIVDQGGADKSARDGLKQLAIEIKEQNPNVKSIALPSGTGTTALYLALALPEYTIYTTPCIGNIEYLREQMSALESIPKNLMVIKPRKKFHFAKLYPELFDIYKKLQNSGIEFDLLYAPVMWLALLEQTKEKFLYIHSGGVSGNESMIKRYEKKFNR